MRICIIAVLLIVTVIGCSSPTPSPTPTAEPTLAPTLISPSPTPGEGFSEDALTLRAALQELIRVKDETWFHVFCYATGGAANQWSRYVSDIESKTFYETGIFPSDLWAMGWDYCKNAGAETEYVRSILRDMEPEWVNMRPVPTPIPELRIVADRPFARTARELADCVWDNPTMYDLFGDDIEASADAEELALVIEAAVESGTETTWDGVIVSLTLCQQTQP